MTIHKSVSTRQSRTRDILIVSPLTLYLLHVHATRVSKNTFQIPVLPRTDVEYNA